MARDLKRALLLATSIKPQPPVPAERKTEPPSYSSDDSDDVVASKPIASNAGVSEEEDSFVVPDDKQALLENRDLPCLASRPKSPDSIFKTLLLNMNNNFCDYMCRHH